MTNRLRDCLTHDRAAYGLWVTLESPSITEIAADLGMDWVCIDTEHGHLDYKEILEHLRAAHGSEMTVLVRVPGIEQHLIKRTLDLGAQGILLPMVWSRDDVARGLEFARYPPRGRRGVGGERAVRWGLCLQGYLGGANDGVMVIPLIETADAVTSIEAILALPGLEAIFFGPADLSASLGHLGAWEGPGVAELILRIKDAAARQGIVSGIIGRNRDDLRRRREQGFRMIGLGSDAGLLIEAVRAALSAVDVKTLHHDWF